LAASTSTTYTGPSPTGSGTYGIFAAQANQAYQDAINQIQQQRGAVLNQSGWQASYDPTGNVTGYSVANNPTGTYQQMLGSLADQGQQEQALQASGLGFSGGVANHLGTQQHDADSVVSSQFGNNLLNQLQDLNNQQVTAGDTYNNALANEQLALTNQQVSKGAFNPAVAPAPKPLKVTTAGRKIWGYGKEGTPFYSLAQAKMHNRVGKGKPR
jgi:hypothetical protein